MFIKFRQKLNKKGFTLIELLIVVAIIGILAAIAIPQFSAYRIRGYNSAAHSDAKNMSTGEEAYFVDNQLYLDVALQMGAGNIGATGLGTGTLLPGAKLSSNVWAEVEAISDATGTFYSIGAAHKQGDKIFVIESDQGRWKYVTKVAGADMTDATVAAATTAQDVVGTNL